MNSNQQLSREDNPVPTASELMSDDIGVSTNNDHPNSVLGKAELILAAFRSGPLHMRLTELSHRSGVPKASVYRLAQEMTALGLLDRVDDGYQLGLTMFELGQRVPIAAVLRSIARPFMSDLYFQTKGVVHLSVLDGTHVLYVEKVGAGAGTAREFSDVGRRFPASCTASGKLLLACGTDSSEILGSMTDAGLSTPTNVSVASTKELQRQLAVVREHGFAIEHHETMPGWSGLAAPIRSHSGEVYAAVAVAVPSQQLAIPRTLPLVQKAARQISSFVGDWLMSHGTSAVQFSAGRTIVRQVVQEAS